MGAWHARFLCVSLGSLHQYRCQQNLPVEKLCPKLIRIPRGMIEFVGLRNRNDPRRLVVRVARGDRECANCAALRLCSFPSGCAAKWRRRSSPRVGGVACKKVPRPASNWTQPISLAPSNVVSGKSGRSASATLWCFIRKMITWGSETEICNLFKVYGHVDISRGHWIR